MEGRQEIPHKKHEGSWDFWMDDTIYLMGRNYRQVEELPEVGTKETFILCEDEEGVRKICAKSVWEDAKKRTVYSARVNHASSTREKISLFMELFHGREDVYAKRYRNSKTKKEGYTPACRNDFVYGVCDHRKYKCPECPNRVFLPLTREVIREHLLGRDQFCRDVVGVYPLLKDDTTWFLSVDFDDADWQKDVAAYCDQAKEVGLSPAVERSRSGSGAHVWFFFERPVPATMARNLGSGLLTKAMEQRHELSFRSYDRFFPNQNTLPKGGFGNLIALPFQGKAREKQNSLFVDEHFVPYPDQWAYLSGVPKIPWDQLERLAAVLCKQSDVGPLADVADETETETAKPWERKKPENRPLSTADFPTVVKLTLSDRLYIEKRGISQAALNRFKRFAAFRNPEFYKAQAMRLSVYNKPRIISCGEETKEYQILPRGCLSSVTKAIEEAGAAYAVEDRRCEGKSIKVHFTGQLREEQQPAADALLAHETGVLSAATAFGKTVIAAYLIGQRQVNTLILVHSSALMMQWKEALEQFLLIEEELPEQTGKRKKNRSLIGQLGSGKNSLNGIVDVAIMQSMFEGEEKTVKSFAADYGMVICDECHHVAAVSFEKVLRSVKAKYVYGLSATPTRQDGHHPIIFMQCGPIRYLVDARSQAEKRAFTHFVIPRITKTRLADVSEIQDIYAALVKNELRNNLIVQDVVRAVKTGRTPILLTERREHAALMAEALQGSVQHLLLLVGSVSAKEKREKLEQLKSVPPGESLAVVATGAYVGEGFDEPRLDTLFLTMPISWKGKVAQYVGRLHRNYAGKSDVRVYDYVDLHVPPLERMYRKRLKEYIALGYQVLSGDEDASPGMVYTGETYAQTFYEDIAGAGRSIVIAGPAVSAVRKSSVIQKLKSALDRCKITIITKPPEEYPAGRQNSVKGILRQWEESGFAVLYRDGLTQQFAVFDESIVWYGGINYMSYAKGEDNAIRMESQDLAGELLTEYAMGTERQDMKQISLFDMD